MAIPGALHFWKNFNILEFQRYLDSQATDIAQRQDESNQSRKKLVELSREFKKTSSEELRQKMAPLLKSFQSEIDCLSKRSQAAETVFLEVYRKIIEVPDPVPMFEQAVQYQQKLVTAQNLEIENKQLREVLQEYNSEFAHVRNQEVTIVRLREQIKDLEEKMQQTIAANVSEKEAELYQVFKEKERKVELSSAESLKRLAFADNKVATLEAALQSSKSELFELKNKFDEEAAARASEVEILMIDLERANQRAAYVERQLELANQSQARDSKSEIVYSTTPELEVELQAKEKQIMHYVEDIAQLQSKLTATRESSSKQIQMLEERLSKKSEALKTAEEQLATQTDYDEIKEELRVMKLVEFSSSTTKEDVSAEDMSSKPLEVLLLEKTRGLQNENTSLKLELSQLQENFSTLQYQYNDALRLNKEQKCLISQLENDLLLARPYLAPKSGVEESVISSSEIISEALKSVNPEPSSTGSSSSLLSIVTNQRERLKQRNAELEMECNQQKQTVTTLEHEVESLREDNVKLYEKIRFLQSYPTTKAQFPHQETETVTRYSARYEAQLDPFSVFNTKERQRKYTQLSGPDKATLVMGRFILSNKMARMFTFFYAIFLHFLVMLVLFRLMNTAASERDTFADCSQRFSEHMQLFHLHGNGRLNATRL